MNFEPPLETATLVKRYKRFLADVTLSNGEALTVHCPNTGSMKNCWEPGWKVYLQDSNNPKRKYRYTWIMAENPQGERIGVNTHLANSLVEEALSKGVIKELANYEQLRREVKYGNENSRIDFLLDTKHLPWYVEVKSVTLKDSVESNQSAQGYFPDAVSTRGQKHLRELIQLQKSGQARAALLFCVQHSGINQVSAAAHIDPDYATLLDEAKQAGVKLLAYRAELSDTEIRLTEAVPVIV
ncbi:MAG: DNA/RNA nuclease SfsA [Gammaproteobacteria bacterium]|nr:DNA/RNA nuclease SfsA [Gammaproteobacteria bacterium]